jgi:hypothetical protein
MLRRVPEPRATNLLYVTPFLILIPEIRALHTLIIIGFDVLAFRILA